MRDAEVLGQLNWGSTLQVVSVDVPGRDEFVEKGLRHTGSTQRFARHDWFTDLGAPHSTDTGVSLAKPPAALELIETAAAAHPEASRSQRAKCGCKQAARRLCIG